MLLLGEDLEVKVEVVLIIGTLVEEGLKARINLFDDGVRRYPFVLKNINVTEVVEMRQLFV